MIQWTEPALEDLDRIAAFVFTRNGLVDAEKVIDAIESAAETIDQPMNLSKPGRVQGTIELLIKYKRKPQYLAIFMKDDAGDFFVLRVKHTLEQYP